MIITFSLKQGQTGTSSRPIWGILILNISMAIHKCFSELLLSGVCGGSPGGEQPLEFLATEEWGGTSLTEPPQWSPRIPVSLIFPIYFDYGQQKLSVTYISFICLIQALSLKCNSYVTFLIYPSIPLNKVLQPWILYNLPPLIHHVPNHQ